MTTLTARLRAAVAGLRTGGAAVAPAQTKAAAAGNGAMRLWPDYRNQQPLWSMTDIQSFVDYGFSVNAVIYAACMYRADAVNTAQLRGYRGTSEDLQILPPADPLARLLLRPNRFQSSHEFHALNSVFFGIAGQSYIWFKRPRPGLPPVEMYTLRPDWVKIVPNRDKGGEVIGYVYSPTGTALQDGYPLLPEDVMHVKRPNPNDPLMGAGYGFSPMGPLAQSANVDNDVTKFLKVFFQSGAMFQNAVSFEGSYDPDVLSTVRQRLKEIYGGVENWNEWAVFDGSAKIQRVSPTFEEMGFEAIDSRNEARILMALGVPPILVGSRFGLERSTYSNYAEARQAFWEDRLLPELRMFESEYQYFLSDGDKLVKYDLSDVPALRKDTATLTKAAKDLVDMGAPPRLAYTTVGLEVPAYDGDMDRYVNLGGGSVMTPVGAAATAEQASEAITGENEKARKAENAEGYAVLYLDQVEGLILAQDKVAAAAKAAGVEFDIVPRAELHITLVYADNIGNASLKFIGDMVAESGTFKSMSLSGSTFEWFGQDETKQALVVRVDHSEALKAFQAQIYDRFEALNIDLEMGLSEFSVPAVWKPHVTLGYGKPFAVSGAPVEFNANRFVLARDDYRTVFELIGQTTKQYDHAAMGIKMDTLAVNWEQRYGDRAVDLFRQEQREISAMLYETQKSAYRQKATINWDVLRVTIEQYYRTERPTAWREAFVPLIQGTMQEAGTEWAGALGVAWNVRNLTGELWFQSYMLKFAQPINENSSKAIQDVLAQAMAEGWTIPQSDERLKLLFEQWMEGDLTPEDFAWLEARLPDYRREAISRTESIRAASQGTLELGKSWGVKRKFWIGSLDGRQRASHEAAIKFYNEQGAIPIDQPFIVNGVSMNAPGDPGAPAKEVVNCRCTPGLLMD